MDRHGRGLAEESKTAGAGESPSGGDTSAQQTLTVVAGREVTDDDIRELRQRVSNENDATAAAADPDGRQDDEPQTTIQALRMAEALLFASAQPLEERLLAERLPDGVDIKAILSDLQSFYAPRGVHLVQIGRAWGFRTAPDLSFLMEQEKVEPRRLSKAAIETLAIIAYHQPVTRAEIEDIRGVAVSKGTLDLLMELDWVQPKGRRRVPGRPLTYGTGQAFLEHFGLESVTALPGLDDLKAAGLLEARLPPDFTVPMPKEAGDRDDDDIDPLDDDDDLPEFLEAADPGPDTPADTE